MDRELTTELARLRERAWELAADLEGLAAVAGISQSEGRTLLAAAERAERAALLVEDIESEKK